MHGYIPMCAGAHQEQRCPVPRSWSYRWLLSHVTQVLGSKLRSLGRAVYILTTESSVCHF